MGGLSHTQTLMLWPRLSLRPVDRQRQNEAVQQSLREAERTHEKCRGSEGASGSMICKPHLFRSSVGPARWSQCQEEST